EASLHAEVEALNLSERVVFEGVIPADKIPARLAAADLLVLPSRWDGWGLVVNEAFAAGVPVIVSDCCGAADLIDHGVNGYVFRSERVNELRDCVFDFLNRETDRSSLAKNASEMGNRISTELAAPYFIACLKHVLGLSPQKPIPPWSVTKMTAP
ncbi:MAG: glycosyltransferase, partial [Pyrinomonadaceae bacterium]